MNDFARKIKTKSNSSKQSFKLIFGLSLLLLIGLLLRVVFVQDMEYKEDEQYNFTQSQIVGVTQPWPWVGIPSGVYLVNPGMSVWVFAALAKLFQLKSPTSLAHGVQLFALLGMSLLIPFALKVVQKKDQIVWLWAFAFAMVNPFLILYQRKLWPEPFLPFFTVMTLAGWWKRDKKWGAWGWGLLGAFSGQIHMSGFFFSAALFLWTVLFKKTKPVGDGKSPTQWKFWFLGSFLGALPLLPWLHYLMTHPIHESMTSGWSEMIQFKYWAFWLTDPLGLHLGNPLGLLRGNSNWAQISDFVRYPLLGHQATYLVGLAHGVALISTGAIILIGVVNHWKGSFSETPWRFKGLGNGSDTDFVVSSAFWGCGLLMTLTGVVIRRYYMAVTFPLEFIFLIRFARPATRVGQRLLTALWIAECAISAGFVGYIHVNHGSTDGDYGPAYHRVIPQ